jgi:riboflavin synthase
MFTGIITDIGELVTCREGRFAIRCGYPAAGILVGASIACDGACLTATRSPRNGCVFTVDAQRDAERTTLECAPAAHQSERALKRRNDWAGIVGLPDGVGRIVDVADGSSRRFTSRCPRVRRYLAPRIRRAGRHLAHRQRGYQTDLASISSPPAHTGPKARRQGQPEADAAAKCAPWS